ncbi:sulfotransferase 1A1-like isoform X1 [Asterias amurensis]|uniref:sulfotransferase 1A1-like isoform X1 n=2 Tax=Asterias amurensis TaxID=7602 RepID=UPI003AB8FEEB
MAATTDTPAGKDTSMKPKQSDALNIVRLNGVNWPWMVTQESLDTLRSYDVWEDDVWVTTYPKAGTHWVMEIVNLILVKGNEDKANRAQQSSPVEFDPFQPGRRPLPPNSPGPQYKAMKQWKAPRVIMTHLKEEMMPSQIYQGKGKVIYVIRNPKDTTVSNWKFLKDFGFHPRYKEWDFFAKESFTEEIVFGSWFSHVLDFWNKHQHDKNFLFVKYEDMKKDRKGAVIQVADFLGKRLSDEEIDRVTELSSLESMKQRFSTSKPDGSAPSSGKPPATGNKPKLGAPSIIRKGVVGDWKSYFTVAQSEAVDTLYREKMAGSSLTVEF